MPRTKLIMAMLLCSITAVLWVTRPEALAQAASARLTEAASTIRDVGRALIVKSPEEAKRYNPEFEREQTERLQLALRSYIAATLEARPNTSTQDLQQALKSVYDPWTDWGDMVAMPQAWRINLKGEPFVIVASLLNRNGQGAPRSKALIEAYAIHSDNTEFLASTGEMFDGHGLFARELTSQVPGESWFLVYGKRFGDSGARSEVALYAFDGKQFQTKWSKAELSALHVNVQGDIIELDYWTPEPASVRKPVHERYRLTDQGVVRAQE